MVARLLFEVKSFSGEVGRRKNRKAATAGHGPPAAPSSRPGAGSRRGGEHDHVRAPGELGAGAEEHRHRQGACCQAAYAQVRLRAFARLGGLRTMERKVTLSPPGRDRTGTLVDTPSNMPV